LLKKIFLKKLLTEVLKIPIYFFLSASERVFKKNREKAIDKLDLESIILIPVH